MPSVVVRDELRTSELVDYAVVPGPDESFHAVTVPRRFELPRVKELTSRPEAEVLGARAGT